MVGDGEAVRFFESLSSDIDRSAALRWGFLLSGATEVQVGPLMETVERLGFTDIEPLFDEEHEGRFILYFSEVCVHTARSFAERVALVEQVAAREGLVVADYSAGYPA
jgi:hypothetical protein